MINNDLIADKIEEVIGHMFTNFRHLTPSATEYSIFYDPQKHDSWIIVIYFTSIQQLRQAIYKGICFQIHSFLLDELKIVDEISIIKRLIFFESGNRPIEKIEIDRLFDKLLIRLKSLQKDAGKTDIKICSTCGHDFNKHQMLFLNETGKIDTSTEGWIMCPEEDCNCFHTWSFNDKGYSNSDGDNKKNSKWSWLQGFKNRKKPSA